MPFNQTATIPRMSDRARRFLNVLRSGNRDERLALLQEMPVSPMRDAVSTLFLSQDQVFQVTALGTLLTAYGFGQAAEFAVDLSRAAYVFGLEVYKNQGPTGSLLLETVSTIAVSGLSASNLMGHYSESVEFAKEVITDLEQLGEQTRLPDIYAYKIEALIGLGQLEDASKEMVIVEAKPQQSADLPRLKERLDKEIQSVVILRPSVGVSSQNDFQKSPQLANVLDLIGGYLTKSSGEMNEVEVNRIMRGVDEVFYDEEKCHDSSHLLMALGNLQPLKDWAERNGHTDLQNDVLWRMYLCYSRIEEYSNAADVLQLLRQNVEKARSSIADPIERGGVGSKFPYLYPSLCRMLHQAGRTKELLHAMEGAKGRAVADLLVKRNTTPFDEDVLSEPINHIPVLMQGLGAHYLSFFVDEMDTYAVLVAKDGTFHQSNLIPLGRETIREVALKVDPRTWGIDPNDPLGPTTDPVDSSLAPLLSWLQPHYESGLLEEGDHVCYSPDEHLHHVPLHYVHFNGDSLVAKFSVSRVHGAYALSILLNQPAAKRPGEFVVIEVPTKQEHPKALKNLPRARKWLQANFTGEVFVNEDARLDALKNLDLKHKLIHISTHGRFPEAGTPGSTNPYCASGLLLAGPGGLPDIGRVAVGDFNDILLTPEYILGNNIDLTGSHVTLQACISGLAEEGLGGDALGLDWALMQAGACSILASHWRVSAELSATYFEYFYTFWLKDGMSRAAAWRATIKQLQRMGEPFADPYSWAAFSLSGDWR